jgi:hypothetical protein
MLLRSILKSLIWTRAIPEDRSVQSNLDSGYPLSSSVLEAHQEFRSAAGKLVMLFYRVAQAAQKFHQSPTRKALICGDKGLQRNRLKRSSTLKYIVICVNLTIGILLSWVHSPFGLRTRIPMDSTIKWSISFSCKESFPPWVKLM